MTGTLQITNRTEWEAGLATAYAGLELTSEAEVAELAGMISAEMRSSAPVMPIEERAKRLASDATRARTRKRPGKTTIRFVRGHDARGFYIDVGPSKGAFYLAFAEYGTKFQRARPFLRPAIEKAIAAWGTTGSRGT